MVAKEFRTLRILSPNLKVAVSGREKVNKFVCLRLKSNPIKDFCLAQFGTQYGFRNNSAAPFNYSEFRFCLTAQSREIRFLFLQDECNLQRIRSLIMNGERRRSSTSLFKSSPHILRLKDRRKRVGKWKFTVINFSGFGLGLHTTEEQMQQV